MSNSFSGADHPYIPGFYSGRTLLKNYLEISLLRATTLRDCVIYPEMVLIFKEKKRSSPFSPQPLEQSKRVTVVQLHPCHDAFLNHLFAVVRCVLSNVAILRKLI